MKLCERCVDCINKAEFEGEEAWDPVNAPNEALYHYDMDMVKDESECQFWAHKKLNELLQDKEPHTGTKPECTLNLDVFRQHSGQSELRSGGRA